MNIIAPCKYCERKGCGAYHNECPDYKEYRDKLDKDHEKKCESSKIDEFLKRYEKEKKKALYKKYKRK